MRDCFPADLPLVTVYRLLIEVRSLLSDRAVWTKAASARSPHNVPVDPETPRACQFCLTGAIQRVRAVSREYPYQADATRPPLAVVLAVCSKALVSRIPPANLTDLLNRSGEELADNPISVLQLYNDSGLVDHTHVMHLLDQTISELEYQLV